MQTVETAEDLAEGSEVGERLGRVFVIGKRVDDLTTNELIEALELPGQPIAMQAIGKGKPLYGEGQFATEPDLLPRSTVLPSAYIAR